MNTWYHLLDVKKQCIKSKYKGCWWINFAGMRRRHSIHQSRNLGPPHGFLWAFVLISEVLVILRIPFTLGENYAFISYILLTAVPSWSHQTGDRFAHNETASFVSLLRSKSHSPKLGSYSLACNIENGPYQRQRTMDVGTNANQRASARQIPSERILWEILARSKPRCTCIKDEISEVGRGRWAYFRTKYGCWTR